MTSELRRQGLALFFDLQSLRAGQAWPDELAHALRRCDSLVLCWSRAASLSSWVQAEYRMALLRKLPIFPWRLDESELPPELARVHAVAGSPATAGPALAAAIRRQGWANRRRWLAMATAGSAAAAGLAAAYWPRAAATPPSAFFFEGYVRDLNGPVDGAEVTAPGARAATDAAGRYRLRLPHPPPPTVRLKVRSRGYISQEIEASTDVPDFGIVLEKAK